MLAFSLELPLETAVHALKKAVQQNLRVVLDPGGIDKDADYSELLKQKIFMLKPNEHEAKILTGIDVTDFQSARKAAMKLFELDIENVMITHGECGAYLFGKDLEQHIPISKVKESEHKDETGCGDQVAAVLASEIANGSDIVKAAEIAVKAGVAQFYRVGIKPISKKDI